MQVQNFTHVCANLHDLFNNCLSKLLPTYVCQQRLVFVVFAKLQFCLYFIHTMQNNSPSCHSLFDISQWQHCLHIKVTHCYLRPNPEYTITVLTKTSHLKTGTLLHGTKSHDATDTFKFSPKNMTKALLYGTRCR